jgi:hypothetical protein
MVISSERGETDENLRIYADIHHEGNTENRQAGNHVEAIRRR